MSAIINKYVFTVTAPIDDVIDTIFFFYTETSKHKTSKGMLLVVVNCKHNGTTLLLIRNLKI